jgi:hypothetical protein
MLRGITKKPQSQIATLAKEAPDLTRCVVVVYVQPLTFFRGVRTAPTDRADPTLMGRQFHKLKVGKPVTGFD